jgi:hypothetical protein
MAKKRTEKPKSESIICPFTVLIDSNEQHPFEFENIRSDANRGNKPLIIHTQWQCLGRHPKQLGDYSIEGFIGRVHVERKSIVDCQSTVLGWNGARDRFERELFNLSRIEAPLVVVEGTTWDVLNKVNKHRTQSQKVVAKQLHRSLISLMQDYHVPWWFAKSRREAEITTFRWLERFWKKQHEHSQRVLAMLEKL